MHPALPGPAGTPASQPQHCYPESGERLLHRVAFLLFSITKPSVVRASVIDIYTRLPQRPAAREWVWHTKPATLQNLHTCKKKKASTPPENSAATHTNIALVTWEQGGHGAFLAHSNVSSYRRAINKPGVRAGGGALHPPAQGKVPALSAPRGTQPRAKEAPGSCQSCSGQPGGPRAQGSTAASWGCSSSQGFNPGPHLCWCCCPLARALHEIPSSSSSPSWAHSPPSSNTPGWGRCFTVSCGSFPPG